MLTLITGGARSGKSTFAQTLCAGAEQVTYIATARLDPGNHDHELQTRIHRHQQSRPKSWLTIEEPIDIAQAVRRLTTPTNLLLIDCLTIWLSNLLFEWRDSSQSEIERTAREHTASLIQASQSARVIAVTNEVGSGIVPESPLARHFRDLQGFLNQQVAHAANAVYLVVSGIPMRIKPGQGSAL